MRTNTDLQSIGFISTMRGGNWGGSEELWSQLAVVAQSEGHHVYLSLPPWKTLHDRITYLQTNGAYLSQRSSEDIQLVLPVRGMNRVLRHVGVEVQPYHNPFSTEDWIRAFPGKLDNLIISQGGVFCGLREPGLVPWLKQTHTPYWVICQANQPHMKLTDEFRQRAVDYLSAAKRVAFVSRENLETAQIQLAHPLPNAVVVQNPLNMIDTTPVPWPHEETGCLNLACVARLDVHAKGQDILLQALAQPQWHNRLFQLSFYGIGPDEAYLRQLVEYLHLSDRVCFHGYVQNVREIWQTHHALAMSSHYEGTPLSLLEAMVCGRPAVVTDVGGNRDVVQHGKTGFLCRAPQVQLLSNSLEQLWKSKADLKQMGDNARQVALNSQAMCAAEDFLRLVQRHHSIS